MQQTDNSNQSSLQEETKQEGRGPESDPDGGVP
jgi:hypothetical protein